MDYTVIANEIETIKDEWVYAPDGTRMTRKEFREWQESQRN